MRNTTKTNKVFYLVFFCFAFAPVKQHVFYVAGAPGNTSTTMETAIKEKKTIMRLEIDLEQ